MYKSIKTIPIYNFYQIIEESDLRYIYKSFDDNDPESFKAKINHSELSDLFELIFYEYCDLTSDHNLRIKTRKQFLIKQWEIIHDLVCDIIIRYENFDSLEVLSLLVEIDKTYAVDFDKPIPEQIEKIKKKITGLKNKIKIYKSKFVNSRNKKKEAEDEEEFDLETEAINIELALELKRAIDVRETSASYYLKLKKLLLKKQESYGNSKNSRVR